MHRKLCTAPYVVPLVEAHVHMVDIGHKEARYNESSNILYALIDDSGLFSWQGCASAKLAYGCVEAYISGSEALETTTPYRKKFADAYERPYSSLWSTRTEG